MYVLFCASCFFPVHAPEGLVDERRLLLCGRLVVLELGFVVSLFPSVETGFFILLVRA